MKQYHSATASQIFWSLASELRRILQTNLSDEGKRMSIEATIMEAREELREIRNVLLELFGLRRRHEHHDIETQDAGDILGGSG